MITLGRDRKAGILDGEDCYTERAISLALDFGEGALYSRSKAVYGQDSDSIGVGGLEDGSGGSLARWLGAMVKVV